MSELKKELMRSEEWLPNLGLTGVMESLEELKEEVQNYRHISQL